MIHRFELLVASPNADLHSVRGLLSSHLDAIRNVGDDPAHELSPGTTKIFLSCFVTEPALEEIPDEHGCGATTAETLGDERGDLLGSIAGPCDDRCAWLGFSG